MKVMKRVQPGEVVRVELPYSEVCMHLRVAGEQVQVSVLVDGAQLLDESDRPFSFAITHGEAGIYRDAAGLYTYTEA